MAHPTDQRASSPESAGEACGTVEVPARYAREIEARERVLERCPIDVYVAGVNDRYSWPHRLVSASEASRPALRKTCETLIVDSVIGDPYFAVEDVLDAADRIGADYVIGKDWPPFADPTDKGGVHAAEAIDWFMSHYTGHECAAEVIVPLYPPFDADALHGVRDEWIDYYALGGLRDLSGEQQVAHIREFREQMGFDVCAHGLGVGTSPALIAALRESIEAGSPLLDSLDISTPENAVRNNKIPSRSWTQQRNPLPSGTDSTTVRAGFAEAIARMLAYELTPDCDDLFGQQQTLDY